MYITVAFVCCRLREAALCERAMAVTGRWRRAAGEVTGLFLAVRAPARTAAAHNRLANDRQIGADEETCRTQSPTATWTTHEQRSRAYIGWQWRNFVPYLCRLIFAAIL